MLRNVIWNWKIAFTICVLRTIGTYAELCEIHSTSPTCQHLRQMLLTLDDTVDPCENFYGYACNNWRLAHPVPLYDDVRGMLDYQMNLKLITVLEQVDPQTLPLTILNETLLYYKSCLNAANSNALRAYLELIKPGDELEWPILLELEAYKNGKLNFSHDEWPAENFDHFSLIGKLWNYDLTNILLYLTTYRNNNSIINSIVSAPKLGELAHITEAIISNLLTNLGLPTPMALDYTKRIKGTHDYWWGQAKLREVRQYNTNWWKQKVQLREVRQYDTTYGELKRKFRYFQRILGNIQIHYFNDNSPIYVRNEQYLEFLLEYQKQQLSPEEKRNLCNYIMVLLLLQLQRKTAIGKSFNKLDCVKESRDKLDVPMHLLYYEYIYRPEEMHINADVQVLYQKTRDYVELVLAKYLVGYDEVLHKVKERINRTALNMGNMPRSMFTSYFDKLYGDLPQMQAHKFYCNQLNLLIHRNVLKLKDINRTHYIGPNGGFTSIPFYDHNSKMMILPLVSLQPPSYHHTFDAIFKWSNLGYYFANELARRIAVTSEIVYSYMYQNEMFEVEVAYQGYVNEQKSKLQPDFTNFPWKKIFLINLAQSFCMENSNAAYERYSKFVRSIAVKFESFAEAFQCGGKKEKPYCYK